MRYLGLPLSVWQLKRVDYQHLEDKIANKLVPWEGMHITSIGRGALVKSVLTSQAIHHLTPIIVPPSVLQSINKIEHAYLWAGTKKVSGGKCKVNGETVYRPTHTTREKPRSSAGFRPLSSAGTGATNKALQLMYSSSACCPTLLLYMNSCSAL